MTPATPVLDSLLTGEEGFRGFVYDDATGQPIRPGSVVKGHPTAGYGLALDIEPLTKDEALYLMHNRVALRQAALTAALEWFSALGEVRQAVLLSMAYQMGVAGLLGFHGMLGQCALGNWAGASALMLQSEWAKQTPARAKQLAAIMETGKVWLSAHVYVESV